MKHIRAVVVDPNVSGRLTIQQVPAPTPRPSEALVRVAAISLNPPLEIEAPWTEIAAVAQNFYHRAIPGKAVLRLG